VEWCEQVFAKVAAFARPDAAELCEGSPRRSRVHSRNAIGVIGRKPIGPAHGLEPLAPSRYPLIAAAHERRSQPPWESRNRVRQELFSSSVCGVNERARYANQAHKIRVTDGHEAEAKAAQLRKRPNRMGLLFLKMLGFRSQSTPPTTQRGHGGPSHEHPSHHEHSTPTSS
jgi:hypothetical protein